MASFAAFATRNLTTFLAGILIDSPVAGLRPIRAFRSTRTSLPMPGSTKTPFFFTSLTARLERVIQHRARLFVRDFACFRQPANQLGLRHSLSGHQTSCYTIARTSTCAGTPVFTGFRSIFMFASRYNHTEQGERCKAEKCRKRLFLRVFSIFLAVRAAATPQTARGRSRAQSRLVVSCHLKKSSRPKAT